MQQKNWRIYIADAFAEELYGGNQAGVVLLEDSQEFPADIIMCKIAGELKHSETAFVKKVSGNAFHIRYFTPAEEVDLCGHATIAAFSVLQKEGIISDGIWELITRAQTLSVKVSKEGIWMEMASPREIYTFTPKEATELYQAYGLEMEYDGVCGGFSAESVGVSMMPKIVSTGLCDIMLPVKDKETLNRAVQDEERVSQLSEQYQVVGVHMFCLSEQEKITAECRNFAPLYAIPEESATGTANGALSYYLYGYGKLKEEQENVFFQGEAMGKPSYIKSILRMKDEKPLVEIGGTAVISLKGELINEG